MNSQLTARKLRMLLFAVMILVIAATVGGFIFAHKNLVGYATTISQLNANADSGDQSIATLRELEKRLESEQDTKQAAREVVADSQSFADRVVGDVTKIAAESGVTLSSFEFVNTPAAGATAPSATPGAAAPIAPTTPGATPATSPTATAVPSGVSQKSISVTLGSPLTYDQLLAFIRRVESNDLKLQISAVNITKSADGTVGTQTFSIGAYVR